jgi:hypothetical protein
MSKDKRPISDVVKAVANLGLNFTEGMVEKKVQNPMVEDGIKLVFPLVRQLLEALNDDNPANAEQVRAIILKWINNDLANFVEKAADHVLTNTKDPAHFALLDFAQLNAVRILRVYTDENKDNKAQLDAYFQETIQGEELEELAKFAVLGPILDKANASPDLKMFVEKALDFVFEAVRK